MCKWEFPRPQVHRDSAWAFGPGTSVAPSAADIEPPASWEQTGTFVPQPRHEGSGEDTEEAVLDGIL